jgi:hypothetical protein
MNFILHAFKAGMTARVDAVGVLVKGEAKDVVARGLPLNRGRGATIDIKWHAGEEELLDAASHDAGGFIRKPPVGRPLHG